MNTITRQLRIFISSTFRDMQQERDQLVKYVFPKIKKIARERFVEVTEIDLRWGITEEQANSGETLKICLDEIDKCKESPIFFIGLLGNRYGWIPDNLDSKLFSNIKYSWIEEYKHKSVTELEVLYSVIHQDFTSTYSENNPKRQFYFKGKNFNIENSLGTVNHKNKSFFYFREESLSKEIENNLQIEQEDKLSSQKLKNLKDTIKNKNIDVYDYYTIDDFKEQILQDLISELDKLYPINKISSEIEKTRLTHKQFANSRKKVYIKDQSIFDLIDVFINSDIQYLTIQSESGLGKSSLIANYIDYYESKHTSNYIIEHYIGGAGEQSADIKHILFRILSELKDEFTIQEELPKYEEIINKFSSYIYNIQSDKKIIIFLDAIDQLLEEDEKRLYFLPRLLPKNIKMVMTSIDTINLELSQNIVLKPLDKDSQINLINIYLNTYSKNLSPEQLDIILNSSRTNNTLYLKTLLDEIRVYGEFDNLTLKINQLIKNENLDDLFSIILRRIEKDASHDSFIDVLSLLWCSKDGLSEDEILEIVNGVSIEKFQDHVNKGKKLKLTQIELSNILLLLDDHIIYKNGLICFFNKHFYMAIENTYLQSNTIQKQYRYIISYYFNYFILNDNYPNKIELRVARELPYQQYKLSDDESLIKTISTSIVFFYKFTESWEFEIYKYYKTIKLNNKEKIFSDLLVQNLPMEKVHDFRLLAIDYIKNHISWNIAKEYYEELLKYLEAHKIFDTTYVKCLRSLGQLHLSLDNYNFAKNYFSKALKVSKKLFGDGDKITLSILNSLGSLYYQIKQYDQALKIRKQLVSIIGDINNVSSETEITYYFNLATVYKKINSKQNEAKLILEKLLSISKKRFGDEHSVTIDILGSLVSMYRQLGMYDLSEKLNYEFIKLSEKKYGINHIEHISNSLQTVIQLIKEKKYKKAKLLIEPLYKHSVNSRGVNHFKTKEIYDILVTLEQYTLY